MSSDGAGSPSPSPGRWPEVCVVVPTRGRPDQLAVALPSVLGQDYPGDIECIVVFDQQTPAPLDVPSRVHRSVRALVNQRTPGPAGARNEGILGSVSPLVAFCDDDDVWAPEKLRAQVQALIDQPKALAVGCGIELQSGARRLRRLLPRPAITYDDLSRSRQTVLHTSTVVVRREPTMLRVGLFDETIPSGYGEDYEWFRRIAAVEPIAMVAEPLVRVLVHDSWFATRWADMADSLIWQIEHHPELTFDRGNGARMCGRVAFACAAAGRREEARRWARRSLRSRWWEPRGYLALLVDRRVLRPRDVVRMGRSVGRGI